MTCYKHTLLILAAAIAGIGSREQSKTATGNAAAWEAIGLVQAAHTFSFKKPVKVAIIDDGFDTHNPLWASHIAHNTGEIPGNEIDDDHNGKTDDYEGWDFGDNDEEVNPDSKLADREWHGTRVLGVFWQALQQMSAGDLNGISILPIKAVSDTRQNNYLLDGYAGIAYAIAQKADVIICSWAGPNISGEEKALLASARAKGILIVAAAGNFYALQPQYPGAAASVIGVAATNNQGKKLRTSNYGVFVDISAPGDSLSTYDPYQTTATAFLSATSAATPVVGAVVTALRAAYPGLSANDIERTIKNTATPLEAINPLYSGNLGAGLINVSAIHDALRRPAMAGGEMVFRQPKAYIDLLRLSTMQAVRIVPTGKYRSIKFLLSAASANPVLPAGVRVRLFSGGLPRDTVIRAADLKYPFFASADSLHIYGTGNTAAANGGAWWYYEVTTIDSSTLYCGGAVTTVTGSEGIIADGSGNQNYTGRNDCKWQITVPEGKKIQLEFEQFDTEPKLDQVYIFSGNSTKDPILAIFSGHQLPPAIKSWSNTVLVWFLTSEENNFPGWKLHYKAVDP